MGDLQMNAVFTRFLKRHSCIRNALDVKRIATLGQHNVSLQFDLISKSPIVYALRSFNFITLSLTANNLQSEYRTDSNV